MRRYLNVDLPKAMKEFEVAIKKMVVTRIIGRYQSIFRGRGLEFDAYREYSSGDDASQIDWKASARANELLIKEYVEERDVKIFFLIDVSSSMVFGSTPKLKNEYTLEMIAALANLIVKSGDRVGFALFNDKIVKMTAPAGGPRQLYVLTKSLLEPSVYGGGYNLDAALKFCSNSLSSTISLLIIVSDFVGPHNWASSLKLAARKFDTIGIKVSDPRDRTLPAGAGPIVLSDPYSEKTVLVDPSLIREKYERYCIAQQQAIEKTFQEANADLVTLDTAKPFVIPLINFFRQRITRKGR